MTETEAINACSDPDLLKRVAFSLAKAAKTIHLEIAGPRTLLASKVSLSPQSYAQAFLITALAALSGAALAALTTTASISQASIDTQILSVWDVFA